MTCPAVPAVWYGQTMDSSSSRSSRTASRRKYRGLAVLSLCALAIGAVVWLLPSLDPAALVERMANSPEHIVVLLVALMILHNFLPIPAEAIAICAGATLGIATGAVAIWIGAMLGAALAFWLSRRYGRGFVAARDASGHLARIERDWENWGAPGLIGVRLVPLISFNLINYGAGLTSVGWWTFLWTTAVGILPILLLSVAAGAGLHATFMGPAFLAILGLLCLGPGLVRYLRRRRWNSAANSIEALPVSPDP
ncbi:TVP38/TMEM64 family protein [Tropicimonas aquimaris]|uniref:TVP38/TMEM64 family membrane protein n=1 Tax=Tropicimonas aquimaris TaxID=914152 RepID=A0ABW3IKQ0_9RHOB